MASRYAQDAVRRMRKYVEQNLGQPISLAQLGRAAGYSPWHAARMFKQHTGKSPFDYIRKRRLEGAAQALREGDTRVIDVALDFVFASHEGFTRAFSKRFGMTPKRYIKLTRHGWPALPRKGYHLTIRKGEKDLADKLDTVFVQVIDRPARKMILKRGIGAKDYYEYCEEAGCEVWDTLCDIKDALYEPIGMWMPEKMRPKGTSAYAQGVEVAFDYSGDVPEGFEIIDLPPCKMMVFQGPPFDDDDFEDAIGDLWASMKTYNPKLYGFEWADEDAPRFQLIPLGYRGYIEARPVRVL